MSLMENSPGGTLSGALRTAIILLVARNLRISFIDFLNSAPLGWGLLHGSCKEEFEVLFDVPSQCAHHLATGAADVGLIPVIEYQRIPDLFVVPEIAIASEREVRSVLFVSHLPFRQVARVAVDSSSRTSTALLRILFKEKYSQDQVEFFPHPPDPEQMLKHFDAALLIGNPALKVRTQGFYVYDLAWEWHCLTGLPFVFAFWAGRSGGGLARIRRLLEQSKEEGLNSIEEISQLYSQKLGLTPEDIQTYLRGNLNYDLSEPNLRGLSKFYELAQKSGILPEIKPIRFLSEF